MKPLAPDNGAGLRSEERTVAWEIVLETTVLVSWGDTGFCFLGDGFLGEVFLAHSVHIRIRT